MPKSMAQWTGFAVTMIVVLGRDADVFTAVPLGLAAGMLAAVFEATMRLPVPALRRIRIGTVVLTKSLMLSLSKHEALTLRQAQGEGIIATLAE
jgi:hypothetical protein